MRIRPVTSAAFAVAGLAFCAPPPVPAPGAPVVAITGVGVVDVARGRVVPAQTVLVAGSRITAVGAAGRVRVPAGAVVVDGRGRFVIPGLWDMHTHALWDRSARDAAMPLFVASGVTGIRDMGGDLALALATRAAVRSSAMVGPRIVTPGPILDGPRPVDPSISWAISTPQDGRRAVDSLAAAGADFVKVYTLIPRDAFLAVLARARLRGLAVAGHVPAAVTPDAAARAGQRSMEHMRDELEPYCTPSTAAACEPLFRAFRRYHTWQTPTLVVLRSKSMLNDSALEKDPRLAYAPAAALRDWRAVRDAKLRRPDTDWARQRARFAGELWLAGAMARAGVPLLAGSDADALYTYPGSSLQEELELLVRAGLSPAAALRTATLEPARYLQATDSLGTVAPGRVADLVLLDANPLADIHATRAIAAVVLNGRYLDRRALDALEVSARSAVR
jgi:imidazolonepropionase-like amidohydrolase